MPPLEEKALQQCSGFDLEGAGGQCCGLGMAPHEFAAAGVGLPDAPDNDPDAISPEQRRLIGYDRPALGCAVM